MATEFKNPISIKEAIDAINHNNYLLPAIQRKYLWSSNQICNLFDSIMRGYPINTFMMWEIKSSDTKNDYKFYAFLKDYCQRFGETNEHVKTHASFHDFKAIIDGQQRLTSLYIGLCGTYAYKQPKVWWPSGRDDEKLPPRKLYLDLKQPVISDDDDSLNQFNFRLLTKDQYQSSKSKHDHHWFCCHEIMGFDQFDGGTHVWNKVVKPELQKAESESPGLSDNEFAQEALQLLYEKVRTEKLIYYFNEPSQEIDHVLDIFIRTNMGGIPLAFSDLLTSIAVANWDGDLDFRQELENLTKEIHDNGSDMGFHIERDWILKACLMLIDIDVRFKVKNFKNEQVKKIQSEWESIKKCIKETFRLVRRLGINEQSLASKNAVIPICYYLYKKTENNQPLYLNVNNMARCHEQRKKIGSWFYMALLKRVFGGNSDTILASMRTLLRNSIDEDLFPLKGIIERYAGTNKDLRFDDDYIEGLLDIRYGDRLCRALLHLLFPEINSNEVLHIDHLHPKSSFGKRTLKGHKFLQNDEELYEFFLDERHWNSITNLHLLNESQNLSKSDKTLYAWGNDPEVKPRLHDMLIDENQLEFEVFKEFYEQRRLRLKERLKERVFVSSQIQPDLDDEDSDEEVE